MLGEKPAAELVTKLAASDVEALTRGGFIALEGGTLTVLDRGWLWANGEGLAAIKPDDIDDGDDDAVAAAAAVGQSFTYPRGDQFGAASQLGAPVPVQLGRGGTVDPP